MLENPINTNKLCCIPAVMKKIAKTPGNYLFFGPTWAKKGTSMGLAKNQEQIFLQKYQKVFKSF